MEGKAGKCRESGHEPEMRNINGIEVVSIEECNHSRPNRISDIRCRAIRSIAVRSNGPLLICCRGLDKGT